jgi:hypothetical protein
VAKEFRGAREHVEVTVGKGVEGSGVNAEFHASTR